MNFFRSVMLAAALAAVPLAAQENSALERDPKGWTDVMPNARLDGWTRMMIPPTAAMGAEQWRREGSLLVCEGNGGHDWIRYDAPLENFIFHVEFRFVPLEGNPRYNSGVFVRNSADYGSWFQAQVGPAGGFIFGVGEVNGERKRVNLRESLKEDRIKPAGEWNTVEVTAQGAKLTSWVNGAVVSEWDQCPLLKGHIGLEGEGFKIEFRNLKLKNLP